MEHIDSNELEPNRSELFVSLLTTVDGWETTPSRSFQGGVELIKPRKADVPISLHYMPEEGRFRKLADEGLYSPKVDREHRFWEIAMDHFNVNDTVSLGTIKKLKADPSRGYQALSYLDMPYMGLPLHYYESILPGTIPEESYKNFLDRMQTLVTDRRIFNPDMNSGNILVHVRNGTPTLFPIDWESANPKVPENKVEYYSEEQRKRCIETIQPFYPIYTGGVTL
jgi:hypothetical protein